MALVRYIIDGVASGAVIALMGLGVVIVYRSTRVLTFAQGALASLNAYLFFQLAVEWGWPVWLAFAAVIPLAALVGAACERLVIWPLRGADALTRTIATLGLVLLLQVVMGSVWGGSERFVPPLVTGSVSVGGEVVGAQSLLIAGLTLVVAGGLVAWSGRSYTGLSMAAMADEPEAARLLGVSPDRTSLLAWVIASVLGAIAGVLVTPLLVLNPVQMTLVMVTSFAAALVGGFVSLPLTLLGGLGVGIVRSIIVSSVSVSGLSETLGFMAVFAVLLATRGRRTGLADLLRGGTAPL